MTTEALMPPPWEDGVDLPPSAPISSKPSTSREMRCGISPSGLGLIVILMGCPCGWAQDPARAVPAKGPTLTVLGGQTARALKGSFNSVPVLHSNQPETVAGPGILIDTSPGVVYTAETGEALANPAFRFQGPFGLHFHHIYTPSNPGPNRLGRRPELSLAAVVLNRGAMPVRLRLLRGAVRNSFTSPYLGRQLLGVKRLGPRPWNTGPGDATAVQMLRGGLDPDLPVEFTIPPGSRRVLLRTKLPALGVANGLIRGESDGVIELAMVAAPAPATEQEVFAILASRQLAPGRTYLNQRKAIEQGVVFSRVSGVALGDTYQASLSHDLERQGPLHVPLTSTVRQSFGTGDVQVNPLATRMADSALDNVGTYGVRFDVDLLLRGAGSYAVVLSHPEVPGSSAPIAFRGSLELRRPEGLEALHVVLRAGESLTLTTLALRDDKPLPLQMSLVQPADSIPGHLLSIVPMPFATASPGPPSPPAALRPSSARPAALRPRSAKAASMPTALPAAKTSPAARRPGKASASGQRGVIVAPPILRPPDRLPLTPPTTLSDRYRQALEKPRSV